MKPLFEIHMGPWPAVAVGPFQIFGSWHVTKDFTTAHVTLPGGGAYNPGGQQFFRHVRSDGLEGEEAVYDFNFKYRMAIPDDGEMCFTHREIPAELRVKSFFAPEIGKVLQIDGRVSGPVQAKVVGFGAGYIQTDWTPVHGDSGSLCWGEDGSFAGAFSRRANGMPGGIIAVPPQVGDPMLAGTVLVHPDADGVVTIPGMPTPLPPSPGDAVVPPVVPKALFETVDQFQGDLSKVQVEHVPLPPPAPAQTPLSVSFTVCGESILALTNDRRIYELAGDRRAWVKLPDLDL